MRVWIRIIISTEHAALLLISHALTVAGNLTVFCWGFFDELNFADLAIGIALDCNLLLYSMTMTFHYIFCSSVDKAYDGIYCTRGQRKS